MVARYGNFGVLTVNNSTITGTTLMLKVVLYQGGELFNDNGTLTVNNSTISNNEAVPVVGYSVIAQWC